MPGMGVGGRATVDRSGYADYIKSAAWRRVRARYWASKLPKWCYCCGADKAPGMHLHHRTYKNLGNERLLDLVPVCADCHAEIHRVHRTDARAARRGLWYATQVIRRRRGGRRRATAEVIAARIAKGGTPRPGELRAVGGRFPPD